MLLLLCTLQIKPHYASFPNYYFISSILALR